MAEPPVILNLREGSELQQGVSCRNSDLLKHQPAPVQQKGGIKSSEKP